MATKNIVLEICDTNWDTLYVTPHVVSASVTRELGALGEGEVTLPAGDPAIDYLPDADSEQSNEGRWKLYEDGVLTFAGVVDQTTRRINSDNTFTFGGKHRGILFGQANMGRRSFNGWSLEQLFKELMRDNIGKAPIASIAHSSFSNPLHPSITAITGDINKQFWGTRDNTPPHFITIDLGEEREIIGVRVIPPWWDNRWYNFRVETSNDDVSGFTDQGGYESNRPLSNRGKMINFTVTCRYVKVIVTDSSDDYGRLASVLVYRQLGAVGAETDYTVPWIENDDSGNTTLFGSTDRLMTNGAFSGDGVLGNSLTTRLNAGARIDHRFRGTATAAYFTQGINGGSAGADIYLDNVFQQNISIPADSYQYEGFIVDNLSNTEHYLSVRQTSGTPKIDYFAGLYETSYRKIRDDDPSIGYYKGWQVKNGKDFTDYEHKRSTSRDSYWFYEFKGDSIKVIGSHGPTYGIQDFRMDGSFIDDAQQYRAVREYEQTLFNWSGSYVDHDIRGVHSGTKHVDSAGYFIDVDELRGNFQHIIYMRSFWESNLRMLTRLSEITQSYLRFNDDGTVDLLGKVGAWSGTIVREGENEGGAIIEADVQDDYSETCSAVLAIVDQPGGQPIKAFVIDRNAVARMGIKIRKVEFADANDGYLLTRQAWAELQDHAYPTRRYNVQFDHDEVGDIEVGETTILYSPSMNLSGSQFRVGRLVTDFDTEEATDIPNRD